MADQGLELKLQPVDNLKRRVILTLCYATGLRISTAIRPWTAATDVSPCAAIRSAPMGTG